MTPMPTVLLADLVQAQPNIAVRFICQACGTHLDAAASAVIRQLEGRGLGDDQTEVRLVGLLAERPCHRCAQMRWETRPARAMPAPPPRETGEGRAAHQ